MNPEPMKREDLEAKVTALLLGELPDNEAALLRELIARDAGLARLHGQLKLTLELLRETTATAEPAPAAPLKLSEARREKLLAQFKTIAPAEFAPASRRKISWPLALASAFALLVILAAVTITLLPKLTARFALMSSIGEDDSKTFGGNPPVEAAKVKKPNEWDLSQLQGTNAPANSVGWLGTVSRSPIALPATAGPSQPASAAEVANVPGFAFSYEANQAGQPVNTPPPDSVTSHGISDGIVASTPVTPVAAPDPSQIVLPAPTLLDDVGPPAASTTREVGLSLIGSDKLTTPGQTIAPAPPADQENTIGIIAGAYFDTKSLTNLNIITLPASNVEMAPGPSDTFFINGYIDLSGSAEFNLAGTLEGATNAVLADASVQRLNREGPTGAWQLSVNDTDYVSTNAALSYNIGVGASATYDQSLLGGGRNGNGSSNRDGSKDSGGSEPLGLLPSGAGGRRDDGGADREGKISGIGGSGGGGAGGGGVDPRMSEGKTNSIDRPGNGQVGSNNFYVDKDTGQALVFADDASSTYALGGLISGLSGKDVTASQLASNAPVSQPGPTNVYSLNTVGYFNIAPGYSILAAPISNEVIAGLESHLSITNLASNQAVDTSATSGRSKFQNNLNKTAEDAAPSQPAAPPLTPQPEVLTSANIFSTFSLNVSDAAFKLAQASLQNGAMPEAAAMRSEEFINAFDYRDAEPAPGAPIGFASERAVWPFAHHRDLLRFSVKTVAQGREAGRPLNLVLLLDKSGSMERADRVEIIHQALRVLASQLNAQDTLSVVVFARTARLLVDGVPGTQAGDTANRLDSLTPEGGTNLEEAIKLAYQTALRHYKAAGENRVVMLTDGAANLGNVEPETLKQNVEANRKQGVALDCFGVGFDGYNDTLMEALSRTGHGRYGFINTPEEAVTEFAGKLAGALRVAASDVKVQVEFNPNRVTSWRQIGYARHQLTKEQFRDNKVAAAQIGAAESGNALYTVEVNPAGDGPLCTVRVRFRLPGTTDYQEHAWDVPYTGTALPLDQASPAMRLAATSAAFSEWLAASPYAGEVTPDQLLAYLRGVPEIYGADARPKNLEWMIRQAKSISGK
jgi:Mg-chelatase subunit ChlD